MLGLKLIDVSKRVPTDQINAFIIPFTKILFALTLLDKYSKHVFECSNDAAQAKCVNKLRIWCYYLRQYFTVPYHSEWTATKRWWCWPNFREIRTLAEANEENVKNTSPILVCCRRICCQMTISKCAVERIQEIPADKYHKTIANLFWIYSHMAKAVPSWCQKVCNI